MVYIFELIGEDDPFAAYEAAAVAEGLTVTAPGVAVGSGLPGRVEQLAWTRTVSDLLARTPADPDARGAGLEDCALEGAGTAAVRARAVRAAVADTQAIERRLGAVLAASGFEIDLESPDRVLRVLVSDGEAFLGWVLARPGGDVGRRRPADRPVLQPGRMSPRLARARGKIVGGGPGPRVLDPMCGTGGIVLEAARVGARGVGLDVQGRMVRGTRRNVRALGETGAHVDVAVGDARSLPLAEDTVDAVAFDVPYGRQSRVAGDDLVAEALAEASRVGTQAVVVADRDLTPVLDRSPWRVEQAFAKRVHRSLTRHIVHLGGGVGEP